LIEEEKKTIVRIENMTFRVEAN